MNFQVRMQHFGLSLCMLELFCNLRCNGNHKNKNVTNLLSNAWFCIGSKTQANQVLVARPGGRGCIKSFQTFPHKTRARSVSTHVVGSMSKGCGHVMRHTHKIQPHPTPPLHHASQISVKICFAWSIQLFPKARFYIPTNPQILTR